MAQQMEEILVNAQRRVTDLQSTAASICALSSEDLVNRSIDDIEYLGISSPIMNAALYQGEAQIYIRGIGYSGIVGGSDSSTALQQDSVYLSSSSAAVPAFFDVERGEVLRGPHSSTTSETKQSSQTPRSVAISLTPPSPETWRRPERSASNLDSASEAR